MTCGYWIKIQFSWIGIYRNCYHFIRTILSIPFCPYHFVPYHFVRIPFCPYHFVRGILSGTILSGHHLLPWQCKVSKLPKHQAYLNVFIMEDHQKQHTVLVSESSSRLHWNNYTGFPSAPVSRSKSPSSCVIPTLELPHHTCHPWLRHILLQVLDSRGLRLSTRAIMTSSWAW